MKVQWMSWLMSGVIVAGASASALAQTSSNTLTQLFPALVGVPLTPTQTIQLERLSQQTLPQLQALLTPAQQIQFNQALAQGKGVRAAALSTNLSAKQQLQMLRVLQTARSQIASLLTLGQQRQIQQNAKALWP
jgi:hypothetical protein